MLAFLWTLQPQPGAYPMIHGSQYAQFIDAYIDTLLWSSIIFTSESDDEGIHADEYEPHDSLLAQSEEDCIDFLRNGGYDLIKQAIELDDGYSFRQAGHDFALTRNGHGAGFWDRRLGKIGKELTADAQAYGAVDLYLDENEFVRIG